MTFGILGLVYGDFTPIWEPVPKEVPAREVLVYACAGAALVWGVGLLWPRFATWAARGLLVQLAIWIVAFRLPAIVRAPTTFLPYDGCAETVAIAAGAASLAFARARIGRVLLAVALVPFGLAHFLYIDNTVALVPHWLPWHLAWAYLTGATFLAAAAAILAGVRAELAAALAALQIGLFTLLVWVPHVGRGGASHSVWSELGISAALAAAAWVVAGSLTSAAR